MPPENVFCVFSSVEDCITWRNKATVCYFSQSEAVWSTKMNFWNVCAAFHQHVYSASFIIPDGPGKQRGLLLCVCRNETDVPRASRTAKVFGASRPVQEKKNKKLPCESKRQPAPGGRINSKMAASRSCGLLQRGGGGSFLTLSFRLGI